MCAKVSAGLDLRHRSGTIGYSRSGSPERPRRSRPLRQRTPTDTANYNYANTQVTLVVNPSSFTGFVQLIDMGGVFNKVKLGSTVPVKFNLDGHKVLCRRPKSPHLGVTPTGLLSGPYRHTYDSGWPQKPPNHRGL